MSSSTCSRHPLTGYIDLLSVTAVAQGQIGLDL